MPVNNLKITPQAASFLRAMIVSCGNPDCFETVKLLEQIKIKSDYLSLAQKENSAWRMSAFRRLYEFALLKKVSVIDLNLVIWYFGGDFHIEIMSRLGGHAGLGQYLGSSVGLVTHVLLPLDNNDCYRSNDYVIKFKNYLDLGGTGERFYHLGVIIAAPAEKGVIKKIKEEQSQNFIFQQALKKIKDPVKIPDDYFAALNCTARVFKK